MEFSRLYFNECFIRRLIDILSIFSWIKQAARDDKSAYGQTMNGPEDATYKKEVGHTERVLILQWDETLPLRIFTPVKK